MKSDWMAAKLASGTLELSAECHEKPAYNIYLYDTFYELNL